MSVKHTRPLQCVTGQTGQAQQHSLAVDDSFFKSDFFFLSVFFSSFVHLCHPSCAIAQPSPQCGDATSFSSHYVLIRGRYRGGGEEDLKQTQRCATELHTGKVRLSQEEGSQSSAGVRRNAKNVLCVSFGKIFYLRQEKNIFLFVAMLTEICIRICSTLTT